ncbi:MAG: methionine ABC transporter ATP-binding protein [Treponema sp.]|nr:methionine ABC transporter ATP-binding protein [Treponema sp.]
MQIRLEHLSKTYLAGNEKIEAVKDNCLTIPENKIFGIIGKSGAGKSSLVRLISLLELPDSGAVYYDDRRVDNLDKTALIQQRRKIGMIFQNFNLFSSRTAGKNVAYPLEICGMDKAEIASRVKEMLALVGLEDREDAPISTLSGGQKQRVAIARALAARPDVLFCDEATSALDPQTTRSILALIREIQAKMKLTVVMITHQMEVVRDACSQMAVIDGGRVVEQGGVEDIFTYPRSPVTKEFLSNISSAESGLAARGGTEAGDGTSSFVRWSSEGGNYILHFTGGSPSEPVLSRLSRVADVEFNIRAAGVQHIPAAASGGGAGEAGASSTAGCDIGTMLLDMKGPDSEKEKAFAFLKENGVIVERADGSEEGK